ncbi:MAG: MFS transporter [Synechococcales cyanobacterium CRU_2_2]|nr:MFS transporter [Synechococcales cyanobacterium CRU_2_2]
MREQGVDLKQIGLLSLVALPLALKFLWAPLIDRFSPSRRGHYRAWIILFQLSAGLLSGAIAFLDVKTQFGALMGLSLLLCLFSTSQDIATDALAVQILGPNERGLGNGIQMAGGYVGSLVGGGGLLMVLEQVGWRNTMLSLALLTLVALVPIIQFDEMAHSRSQSRIERTGDLGRIYAPLVSFFQRPGLGLWTAVLLLYGLGTSLLWGMLRPFLVDLGLSMGEIGWMLGVVAFGAGGIPAALLAGLVVKPLGDRRALIYVGLFQAVALGSYLLPTWGLRSLPVLYGAAIISQMGMSAAQTVVFTIAMSHSRPQSPGSDYSLQSALIYLSGILAMIVSGFVAEAIGYQGLFGVSVAAALAVVGLIVQRYR